MPLPSGYWWKEKHRINQEERDKLTEWDSKANRARWISLEEKTRKYPQIILKLQHSPLQESNCPELAFLLGRAKDVRDSIVHQSPKVDLDELTIPKVANIVRMRIEDATEAVNAAIGYTTKLNSLLGAHAINLAWMHPLGSDGKFGPECFE